MQTSEDRVKILAQLGLTFCEARVYLALVQLGMSRAKMISRTSNVSKPDVYRALGTLQERALIAKIISTPTIYKAVSLEESLSILLDKKETEHIELREKTDQLKLNFKSNLIKQALEESKQQFILIPGKKTELEKRRKEINNTLKSIDVMISWKRLPQTLFLYAEETKEALQRGVSVRFITEKPKDVNSICEDYMDMKQLGFYRIRYVLDSLRAVITIYDQKEVIITTSPGASMGEGSILWTNNISIISVMKEYFETLWAKAKRLEE